MKHLKLFESFGAKVLHSSMTWLQYGEFITTHKIHYPKKEDIEAINKWIKANVTLSNELLCEVCYHRRKDDIFEIKIRNQDYPTAPTFFIESFEDEWYIVSIESTDSSYEVSEWLYKCDSIEGIFELLSKYDEFVASEDEEIDFED